MTTARLRACARDGSTFGGSGPTIVACRIEDSRSGACLRRHPGPQGGFLHVGGHAACKGISPPGGGEVLGPGEPVGERLVLRNRAPEDVAPSDLFFRA